MKNTIVGEHLTCFQNNLHLKFLVFFWQNYADFDIVRESFSQKITIWTLDEVTTTSSNYLPANQPQKLQPLILWDPQDYNVQTLKKLKIGVLFYIELLHS
jgi:hypothetical protein